MTDTIKAIEKASIDDIANKRLNLDPKGNGLFCEPMREGVPELIKAGCEKVIQNANNSSIVLGRDRPGSRASGYAGRGHTHAGSIDIVVGRMGRDAVEKTPNKEKAVCDPDFIRDAARIYLSQKTDIDENFNLSNGSMANSIARSGIGIKADAVRIIAREGIKLITRTDAQNSASGEVKSVHGIDLIAGNDDKELEPMVKGKKLTASLEKLVKHTSKLNSIVAHFLRKQMEFNDAIATHFHYSPFEGRPTTPSETLKNLGPKISLEHFTKTEVSLILNRVNLELFKVKYLKSQSSDWILSRYNNLN